MDIKIAITNLGAYNEGRLLFEWLTLPYTDDDLNKALESIGIDGEQYEEYFITDYEAPFNIGEYANIARLNEVAEALEHIEIPEDYRGIYDAQEVINFIYALENEGLINNPYLYIDDIVNDETLDEMIKHRLGDDAGWLRIRYFLQDADPNANFHRLDGYNNVTRLTNDHLAGIIGEAIEEVQTNF